MSSRVCGAGAQTVKINKYTSTRVVMYVYAKVRRKTNILDLVKTTTTTTTTTVVATTVARTDR